MILLLANVVRGKFVDKIIQSDGYACLTDEVRDILNILIFLTFTCFFDMSTGKAMFSFVETTDILEHSESKSVDSESIFPCLKQVIEDMDLKSTKCNWILLRWSKCYDWQRI